MKEGLTLFAAHQHVENGAMEVSLSLAVAGKCVIFAAKSRDELLNCPNLTRSTSQVCVNELEIANLRQNTVSEFVVTGWRIEVGIYMGVVSKGGANYLEILINDSSIVVFVPVVEGNKAKIIQNVF